MKNYALLPSVLLLCVAFVSHPVFAQKNAFLPTNPGMKYWQEGETVYTEDYRFRLNFKLSHKKVEQITIENAATGLSSDIIRDASFVFSGDVYLEEGVNEIDIYASKKKSKFKKKLRIFYNPYKASDLVGSSGGLVKLHGSYKLSPELGSDDIVISRMSRKAVEVSFLVNACDGENLSVSIEDPNKQMIKARKLGNNVYSFNAKLYGYHNAFVVRARCRSEDIGSQRIVLKVDREIERRKDTAIIFAVTKHEKGKKLGWSELKYSMEDATALKWTLENKYGFGVKIIENPTWETINNTMLGLKTHKWNKLDQLMIYFTGHGHISQGKGYLIPSNAGNSIKTYYEMELLREQIDEIDCKNIMLGIDACFASTFLERGGKDIPKRKGQDLHQLLSSDLPFRYFVGSAPSNKEVPSKGIYLKDSKLADGKYRMLGKKFRVSEFMMAFLESIQMGEVEYGGQPVPSWYVGRKVEELYRPKELVPGQLTYARASRFGSQNDKGFHFINKNRLVQ